MRTPDKFDETIAFLNSLAYRQRRRVLWRTREKSHRPHFLYKFRTLLASDASMDRMRDIIVRSRLWLSSSTEFNDPFDMSVKLDLGGTPTEFRARIDEVLKERGVRWTDRTKEVQRFVLQSRDAGFLDRAEKGFQQVIMAIGVCSFAGDPRSILMWSHYAGNHEGLCLQFEIAKDPETFLKALPVEYLQEYPTHKWVNGNSGVMKILLRKHPDWFYEKERRIVIMDRAGGFVQFNASALAGIIIGCRANSAMIEQLENLLQERKARGFPRPKLYRASKHNSKYKLVISKEIWASGRSST